MTARNPFDIIRVSYMAHNPERREEILRRYTFFAESKSIVGGPSIVSLLKGETVAPECDVFRVTDKTRICKGLKASTLLSKEPVVIYHDGPHIEEGADGRHRWITDIASLKPVPKSWILLDEPIDLD